MATQEQSSLANSQQYHSYEILRKAGQFEVLSHCYHELGIQNNILVSARYFHDSGSNLSSAKIYRALTKAIQEHPALSIVGIRQPSEKKEGHHRLWEARLSNINLQDVVRFIDNVADDDVAMAELFEAQHNIKFDTADKTKPLWRTLVVNAVHVVFVYHHGIGDGISGYAFHRSILAALNDDEDTDGSLNDLASSTIVESSAIPLVPCTIDKISDKLSWLRVIYNLLFWTTLRLFVNPKKFLFSDAMYSKTYPTILQPFTTGERTKTKVQIVRISKNIMNRCISACRQNSTSFTALLHTLILTTLSADIYPGPRLGFSRLAVNLRPLLDADSNDFTNAASSYGRVQFLGKYRAAGTNDSSVASSAEPQVNKDRIWQLAQAYKRELNNAMLSRTVLQDYITGKLLGEDEEEVGKFTAFGLYQNNSFRISNVGMFEPRKGMKEGGWSVQDVFFSAGSVRAAVSDAGIVFNVASAKDGDCVICATCEEGLLRDEIAEKVLSAVLARVELVI